LSNFWGNYSIETIAPTEKSLVGLYPATEEPSQSQASKGYSIRRARLTELIRAPTLNGIIGLYATGVKAPSADALEDDAFWMIKLSKDILPPALE
jgi:hypothetical protein